MEDSQLNIQTILSNNSYIISSNSITEWIQNNIISETQGLEISYLLAQNGKLYKEQIVDESISFLTNKDNETEKQIQDALSNLHMDSESSNQDNYKSPTKSIIYSKPSSVSIPSISMDINDTVSPSDITTVSTREQLQDMYTFAESLTFLNSHYEHEDSDWLKQLSYINMFRYIILTNPSILGSYLSRYMPMLRLYLGSIRSVIAKSAMMAFQELYETYHNDALIEFDENLHAILIKSSGDKAFINTIGEETLKTIAIQCNSPITFETLCNYLRDKNSKIQSLVSQTIYLFITTHPDLLSIIDITLLYKELPILITSKSPECRSSIRDIVQYFVSLKSEQIFIDELKSLNISQYDINVILGKTVTKPSVPLIEKKMSKKSSLRDFIRNQKKNMMNKQDSPSQIQTNNEFHNSISDQNNNEISNTSTNNNSINENHNIMSNNNNVSNENIHSTISNNEDIEMN